MSATWTGVFVGEGPSDQNGQWQIPLNEHETWLMRDVDSQLVFGDKRNWKKWNGNLGWLLGGNRYGGANCPLVFSIPLFPEPLVASPLTSTAAERAPLWAAATSTLSEIQLQAEAGTRQGAAVIIDSNDAFGVGASEDLANAVALDTGSNQWGAVQFNNLPLPYPVDAVRVCLRAATASTIYVMVNGVPKGSVSFPATFKIRDKPTDPDVVLFKELRITGLTINPGDSIKFSNGSGSSANAAIDIDYIAFGNYDVWWRRGANKIKNFRPNDPVIYIRPGWEFNGGWYPWTAADGNEANYIAAFRRFVTIFREESTTATTPSRFRFSWCPNYGGNPADAQNCYPGDDYVDVIGMDLYDSEKDFGFDSNSDRWNQYVTHARGLRWARNFAVERNKFISIDEWGAGDPKHNVPQGTNENPLFIENMQRWLADHRAIFHHYWDATSGYDGKLRDGNPPITAARYVFSFSTPVEIAPGVDAPPANSSDEFDKNSPRGQWQILVPDHSRWSLSEQPGRLRLKSVAATKPDNAFLQRAPDGDFEIVTRLYGKPTANLQTAALLVYQDDNNYVRLGRKYENGQNIFTFATRVGGTFTSQSPATDSLGTLAYLKITRVGSVYRAYYSDNGVTWQQVWNDRTLTLTNAKVGLACYGATGFTADFDTFFVNKLEAEYADLNGTNTVINTAVSGGKYVTSFNTVGDAIVWRNVPGGGSNFTIRYAYAGPGNGTAHLYLDGAPVQTITFAPTGGATTFANLLVNQAVPAGASLKLQCDSGDDPWNVDYITLGHAAKFEAEEATTEGATNATARDATIGANGGLASNDGARRIEPNVWGAVKFANLHAGTKVTLRYLWPEGGTVQVQINGTTTQNVTLPASSSYRSHEIVLASPINPNGAVKFSKSNAGRLAIDYIVVQP